MDPTRPHSRLGGREGPGWETCNPRPSRPPRPRRRGGTPPWEARPLRPDPQPRRVAGLRRRPGSRRPRRKCQRLPCTGTTLTCPPPGEAALPAARPSESTASRGARDPPPPRSRTRGSVRSGHAGTGPERPWLSPVRWPHGAAAGSAERRRGRCARRRPEPEPKPFRPCGGDSGWRPCRSPARPRQGPAGAPPAPASRGRGSLRGAHGPTSRQGPP